MPAVNDDTLDASLNPPIRQLAHGDRYAGGDFVAQALRKLAKDLPDLLATIDIPEDVLLRAAEKYESRNYALGRQPRNAHRLAGGVSEHPYWAGLMPHGDEEPVGVSELRALLLVLATRGSSLISGEQATKIAGLTWYWSTIKNRKLVSDAYGNISEEVRRAFRGERPQRLDLPGFSEEKVRTVKLAVRSLRRALDRTTESRPPVIRTIAPTELEASPPRGGIRAPESQSKQRFRGAQEISDEAERTESVEAHSVTIAAPLEAAVSRAESAPDVNVDGATIEWAPVEGPPEIVRLTKAARDLLRPSAEDSRAAAVAGHRLRLAARLQIGSDYAPVVSEAGEITDYLLSVVDTTTELPRAEAAVGLLGSLLTARSHAVLERATFCDQPPTSNAPFAIATNSASWSGLIPRADDFFAPDEAAFKFVGVTDKTVTLGLPPQMINALHRVLVLSGRTAADGLPLFSSDPATLREARRSLVKELREQASPRATETLLRGFLPAAIFERTQDRSLCILLAGETLGMSDARMHYAAYRTDDIQAHYGEVFQPVFRDRQTWRTSVAPGRMVGAPLAAPNIDRIGDCVRSLVELTKSEVGSDAPGDGLRSVTAMSRYTKWMFIAATAHRCSRLGRVTLNDISLALGLGVISDKCVSAAHLQRVVPIPDLLVRQIRSYLRVLTTALPGLESDAAQKSTAQQIRAALDGTGSLFLRTASESGLEPDPTASPKEELGIDLCPWFLRPAFRTAGLRAGMTPEDIDVVLGHFDHTQPFDRWGWDSPSALRGRIAHLIERCLKDLGFTAIDGQALPATDRDHFDYPHPSPLLGGNLRGAYDGKIEEFQLKRDSLRRQTIAEFKRRAKNERGVSLKQLIEKTVHDFLRQHCDGAFTVERPRERIKLEHEVVARLGKHVLGSAGARLAAEYEEVMLSLKAELRRYKARYGWEYSEPSSVAVIDDDYATIDANVLRAADIAQVLRSHSPTVTDKFPNRLGGQAGRCKAIAAKVLYHLIVHGGCVDLSRAVSCLHSAGLSKDSATRPGHVVVPSTIVCGDDQREESFCFAGRAADAVVEYRSHLTQCPNCDARSSTYRADRASRGENTERCLSDLGTSLTRLLPPGWLPHEVDFDVWHRLSDTLLLALRIEMRGHIWGAWEDGVVCELPAHRMLTLVDDSTYPDPAAGSRLPAHSSESNRSAELSQLIRALYIADREDAGRSRAEQRAKDSVTQLLQSDLRSSLAVLLGRWALDRLDRAAVSTVHHDLTTIAHPLDKGLGERSLEGMEDDELTELFVRVVADKSQRVKGDALQRTITNLMQFNRFAAVKFGIAQCAGVRLGGETLRAVEPSVLLDRELEDALQTLAEFEQICTEHIDQETHDRPRALRRIRTTASLMGRLGTRPSEARRLRRCDVLTFRGQHYLYIRPNQFGALKTTESRRLLGTGDLSVEEIALLNERVEAIDASSRPPNSPLFDGDDPEAPIRRTMLETHFGNALRIATRSDRARPYWARKGYAARRLDISGGGALTAGSFREHSWTVSREMGHAVRDTLFRNYYHAHSIDLARRESDLTESVSAESGGKRNQCWSEGALEGAVGNVEGSLTAEGRTYQDELRQRALLDLECKYDPPSASAIAHVVLAAAGGEDVELVARRQGLSDRVIRETKRLLPKCIRAHHLEGYFSPQMVSTRKKHHTSRVLKMANDLDSLLAGQNPTECLRSLTASIVSWRGGERVWMASRDEANLTRITGIMAHLGTKVSCGQPDRGRGLPVKRNLAMVLLSVSVLLRLADGPAAQMLELTL